MAQLLFGRLLAHYVYIYIYYTVCMCIYIYTLVHIAYTVCIYIYIHTGATGDRFYLAQVQTGEPWPLQLPRGSDFEALVAPPAPLPLGAYYKIIGCQILLVSGL